MIKKWIPALLLFAFVLAGCGKDDNPTPPVVTANYQPTKMGSNWVYETTNKITNAKTTFSVVASSKDTTIGPKTYRVFTNTSGANDYYYNNGNDYYQFGSIGGVIDSAELLYLKANVAVGATWEETRLVKIPGIGQANVKLNYTLVEKLATMQVEGISYSDVLHVKVDISNVTVSNIPIAISNQDIHFYYAPSIGRIKSQIKLLVPLVSINVETETNLKISVIVP